LKVPKNAQAGKKRTAAKEMEARKEGGVASLEKRADTSDLGWKVRRNPYCKEFGFKDSKASY